MKDRIKTGMIDPQMIGRALVGVNIGPKFPIFSGLKFPTLMSYLSPLSVPSRPAFFFSLSR